MRPFLPVLPQPAPVLSAVVVKVTVDRPDVDDVHEAQTNFTTASHRLLSNAYVLSIADMIFDNQSE